MTDKPNVDGSQATEGAGATTNPPVSQKPQSPVEGADSVAKLVKDVVKQVLAEELKPIKGELSGLYSRQDKADNKYGEFIAEFKKQQAAGLNDAQAMDAANSILEERAKVAERDALLGRVLAKLDPAPATTAGTSTTEVAEDKDKVLAEYGLTSNDPAVIASGALNKNGVEFRAAVADMAFKRVSQPKPLASSATALQGQTTGNPDADALMKRYQEEVKPFRGQVIKVSEIQAKYRKAGLNI